MVALEATAMKTPFPCRPDSGNPCLNGGFGLAIVLWPAPQKLLTIKLGR